MENINIKIKKIVGEENFEEFADAVELENWDEDSGNESDLINSAEYFKEYITSSKIKKALEIDSKVRIQIKKDYYKHSTGYYFYFPYWTEFKNIDEAEYYADKVIDNYLHSDDYKNDTNDIEYYGVQECLEDDDEDAESPQPLKKYELVTDDKLELDGHTLYRIKACKSFTASNGAEVNAGDIGGYIEKEDNLEQAFDAWVFNNAAVYGAAKVSSLAAVSENAVISGNAKIRERAAVSGNAQVTAGIVTGNAVVKENAKTEGKISGHAVVGGNAKVCYFASVSGHAEIGGNAVIKDREVVGGDEKIFE